MEHSHVWELVACLIGMGLHLVARWSEWRQRYPGRPIKEWFALWLQPAFMTANVLSLGIIGYWLLDHAAEIPGVGTLKPSGYVPHTPLAGLVLGYVSSSLVKHILMLLRKTPAAGVVDNLEGIGN